MMNGIFLSFRVFFEVREQVGQCGARSDFGSWPGGRAGDLRQWA